ncbi:MAG: Sec-independent protein translocase subunit TatA [Gammaproteobacteria bacterium]
MSFGIKELIVILVIVMLVFGTKKIKGVGSDVGGWIRDFKKALKDGEDEVSNEDTANGRVIDADATTVTEKEKV